MRGRQRTADSKHPRMPLRDQAPLSLSPFFLRSFLFSGHLFPVARIRNKLEEAGGEDNRKSKGDEWRRRKRARGEEDRKGRGGEKRRKGGGGEKTRKEEGKRMPPRARRGGEGGKDQHPTSKI